MSRQDYLLVNQMNSELFKLLFLMLRIDGGGIRGYSSVLILEALMAKIRAVEEEWGSIEGTEPRGKITNVKI
jgi:hypothetical protein